jgi:hypothetical protein
VNVAKGIKRGLKFPARYIGERSGFKNYNKN